MAPNVTEIQHQTFDIIKIFFREEPIRFCDSQIEVDGPGDHDSFNPYAIAEKLRELGDDYDENVIKPLIETLQRAAKDQAADAFVEGVTMLCQSHVAQNPNVAPELLLIQASFALGRGVQRSCPYLVGSVQGAMAAFLNSRVGTWISEHGGWVAVTSGSLR